jgi:hypothetical protein
MYFRQVALEKANPDIAVIIIIEVGLKLACMDDLSLIILMSFPVMRRQSTDTTVSFLASVLANGIPPAVLFQSI